MSAKRNSYATFRFLFTARPIAWGACCILVSLSFLIFIAATIETSRATPEQWQNSVVLVEGDMEAEVLPGLKLPEIHYGTGFALNGRIYTCAHVVLGTHNLEITLRNNRKQKAKLLRWDKPTDLAELSVSFPPKSLRLRTAVPHWFERVWQIGNPGSLRWAIVTGFFLGFDGQDNCFVIDTFFGNSGSPLLDSRGEVIGMTHAIVPNTRFTMGGTLQDLRNFVYPTLPR